MDRHKRLATNGPVRIDRIAQGLLDPVVSRAGFSSTQILSAWPDIVGPELAARTRPEKLRWPPRRGEGADAGAATLLVRAEGGDALDLQHQSGEILARINAMFGWQAVGRIAIRQAPVATSFPARLDDADREPAASGPAPQVDAGRLGEIADDGLRAALARLAAGIGKRQDTKP